MQAAPTFAKLGVVSAKSWVRVYSAPVLAQAHIVRGALQAQGIHSEVRGDHRTALAGGLPMEACFAEVWVRATDVGASEEVLARLLPHGGETGALSVVEADARGGEIGLPKELTCPHCGELNPAHFEICWACDSDLEPSRDQSPETPRVSAKS